MGVELGLISMKEEQTLRVFENWVLREIFRPKGEELTGECRKLHNEELHCLYVSLNIINLFRGLPYDRSTGPSKASSPRSAI
jgi:hypothetical protein